MSDLNTVTLSTAEYNKLRDNQQKYLNVLNNVAKPTQFVLIESADDSKTTYLGDDEYIKSLVDRNNIQAKKLEIIQHQHDQLVSLLAKTKKDLNSKESYSPGVLLLTSGICFAVGGLVALLYAGVI